VVVEQIVLDLGKTYLEVQIVETFLLKLLFIGVICRDQELDPLAAK
jgi:hypothetical protein